MSAPVLSYAERGKSSYWNETAQTPGTTRYSDVTYGGPYYVYAGAGNGIEVMNLAYENKGSGCSTYTLYTTISAGKHRGRWIADI